MSSSSHQHQLFKLSHDPAKRPKARGRGVTFFKGSKRGDVPRVEIGGGGRFTFFLRDPKGGIKKNPVNRNENLQTPPPLLLIKNDTSLKQRMLILWYCRYIERCN